MAASLNDFAAGVFGGVSGIIIGQPLDTIKVRIQTQINVPHTDVLRLSRQIIVQEGARGLYRGVTSPLGGVAALNTTLFGSYGVMKRLLTTDEKQDLTLNQVFIAGAGSGLACCAITTPTELVKCRMQVSQAPTVAGDLAAAHPSLGACVRHIVKTEGVFGLYRGWWATVLRDAPSYGVYFWAYEAAKRWLTSHTSTTQTTEDDHQFFETMVAGGVAGSIAWAVCYPFDVIKTRLQAGYTGTPSYGGGVVSCAVNSVKAEGVGVLFKGIGITVLRAFPVNAVTFAIYDWTLRAMDKTV
eukprot:Colp12_sorted_trinity150504_noHs@35808